MRYWIQIVILSLFLISVGNVAFWKHALQVYSPLGANLPELIILAVLFWAILSIVISLFLTRENFPRVSAFFILITMLIQFFQLKYDVIINEVMLQNILETNISEALELMGGWFFPIIVASGIFPSLVGYKIFNPYPNDRRQFIKEKFGFISIQLIAITLIVGLNGKFLGSFLREHKELRYRAAPLYTFFSFSRLGPLIWPKHSAPLRIIGSDAVISPKDKGRDLVIMVVGETARADHFSLNGYPRKTNLLLEKYPVISFTNFTSCGTSTAVSLPCMFGFNEKNNSDFSNQENLLDVLKHAGVDVLWRDNNSSSKGVAERVLYEDYKSPNQNTVCDVECRDLGLLVGLDKIVEKSSAKDIFIVLHQMGSHGPGYFHRYPPQFDIFRPSCQSTELELCSDEQIINAYDNTLLYTDFFLAETIKFLQGYSGKFNSFMLYVSDHGESLGENGVYLHSMPYSIAPKEQTHVPAIFWFGQGQEPIEQSIKGVVNSPFHHSNLAHSVLGFLEISSEIYNPDLDIFALARGK